MAVVVDPTPQNGIERASQLIQGGAGAAIEPPAPNGLGYKLSRSRRTEGDEERTPPIFRLSSPKRVPEKVELRAGVITSSIVILTKDHVGLLGMQLQPTAQSIQLPPQPQPVLHFCNDTRHHPRSVQTEWSGNTWPSNSRIMQKQIRQQGANDSPLRRPLFPRDKLAVWHLYRRCQPALDVQHDPLLVSILRTARISAWSMLSKKHGCRDRAPSRNPNIAAELDRLLRLPISLVDTRTSLDDRACPDSVRGIV